MTISVRYREKQNAMTSIGRSSHNADRLAAHHECAAKRSNRETVRLCGALTVWTGLLASAVADANRHGSEAFTEPYANIAVAASEPGRISAVHVRRGERVEAGVLLLELDASVLEASRNVAAQRVSATARIEALRVELAVKQRRLETVSALRRDGAVSAEELLTAESELRVAELQVRAAEEELDRYRLELAEIEARIEQRHVRAPCAGVVIEVNREAGEFVSASEPDVVTLVDLSRLRATFYVPTAMALQIGEGMTLDVGTVSATGVAGSPMPGIVEHVAPLTQADSGRVRVDIVIDNSTAQYRSGIRCLLEPPPRQVGQSRGAAGASVNPTLSTVP